jgi:hypothetical protein
VVLLTVITTDNTTHFFTIHWSVLLYVPKWKMFHEQFSAPCHAWCSLTFQSADVGHSIIHAMMYPYSSLGSNMSRVASSFLSNGASFLLSSSYCHQLSCDLFPAWRFLFCCRHWCVCTFLTSISDQSSCFWILFWYVTEVYQRGLCLCARIFCMGKWFVTAQSLDKVSGYSIVISFLFLLFMVCVVSCCMGQWFVWVCFCKT